MSIVHDRFNILLQRSSMFVKRVQSPFFLGSVDISTESDKSGDKTQKSKITGS